MPGATLKRTQAGWASRMRRFPIPRPTTVRRNNTRVCGDHRGALNGRTLPTALPNGPKVFRSGGNPPSIRRNLLLRTQFRHVLRCGTMVQFQTTYRQGQIGTSEHEGLVVAVALACW